MLSWFMLRKVGQDDVIAIDLELLDRSDKVLIQKKVRNEKQSNWQYIYIKYVKIEKVWMIILIFIIFIEESSYSICQYDFDFVHGLSTEYQTPYTE